MGLPFKAFGFGFACVMGAASAFMAIIGNASWPVFLAVAFVAFVIGKVV